MNMQSDSDWDSVTVLKKKAPKPSELRSQQAINKAQRTGAEIDTSKKFNAATNKQHVMTKSATKLDRETEELHHENVGLDVARTIQQGKKICLTLTKTEQANLINGLITVCSNGMALDRNRCLLCNEIASY